MPRSKTKEKPFRITRARRRILLVLLLDLPRLSGYPLCRLSQVGSGGVYVALARMEAISWVASDWESGKHPGERRIFYRLTPYGRVMARQALGITTGGSHAAS